MKSEKILELIKKSGAVRDFTEKHIPRSIIKNVIESGRWGLSILGVQPWKIVCILNREIILKISEIVARRATSTTEKSFSFILAVTSNTIKKARILIAVYNTGAVAERAKKYGSPYFFKSYQAELQVMGGVLQNMFLSANNFGLGAVWLDSPAFFDELEINKMLKQNYKLMSFLAIGYPQKEIIPRSKRKPYNEMVEMVI